MKRFDKKWKQLNDNHENRIKCSIKWMKIEI